MDEDYADADYIRDMTAKRFGWMDFDHYKMNLDAIDGKMQHMFDYIVELEWTIREWDVINELR
jgi:hypothetical protein